MPPEKLVKQTLNLREGDWDYLTEVFRPKGTTTSEVVRQLVSNLVDKLRAAETPDTAKPEPIE